MKPLEKRKKTQTTTPVAETRWCNEKKSRQKRQLSALSGSCIRTLVSIFIFACVSSCQQDCVCEIQLQHHQRGQQNAFHHAKKKKDSFPRFLASRFISYTSLYIYIYSSTCTEALTHVSAAGETALVARTRGSARTAEHLQ